MRSRSLRLAALAASLGAAPHVLHAQASTVAVGARVRVTAPSALDPHQQEGLVLALRTDSLLLRLQPAGDSIALPMAQVRTLEVSQGVHSLWLHDLGLGTATGVAFGAVWGSLTARRLPVIAAVGGGLFGGFAGMFVGGMIGAFHSGERWERVPLRTAGRLSIAPTQGGGVTLSFGVRF